MAVPPGIVNGGRLRLRLHGSDVWRRRRDGQKKKARPMKVADSPEEQT